MGVGISLNGKTILDLTYPIGSLYISKENVSPASLFGGTWEQLTTDAYFKIVSSNGRKLGGTSDEHKIPVESMPTHNHIQRAEGANYAEFEVFRGYGDYQTGSLVGNSHRANGTQAVYITNGSQYVHTWNNGNDQPYYPYYYGVYAWIRIS